MVQQIVHETNKIFGNKHKFIAKVIQLWQNLSLYKISYQKKKKNRSTKNKLKHLPN